jgi:hypothetical protein
LEIESPPAELTTATATPTRPPTHTWQYCFAFFPSTSNIEMPPRR